MSDVTVLSDKQIAFCEEYLSDPSSVKEAAKKAGYHEQTGYSLLKEPHIQEYLSRRRHELTTKMGVSPERVLQELSNIAYFNLVDFLSRDLHGKITVDLDKLRKSPVASAITEIQVFNGKQGTTIRVKVADKNSALDKLGKHLGMFSEKVEVSGKIDFLKLIEDSFTTIDQPKPPEVEYQDADFEEIKPPVDPLLAIPDFLDKRPPVPPDFLK